VVEHELQRRYTYELLMWAIVLSVTVPLSLVWQAMWARYSLPPSQIDTAKRDIVLIQQSIEMYRVQKRGKCPAHWKAVQASGINIKIGKDPWGQPYHFHCHPEGDFIWVASSGPDGTLGTEDDLTNHDEM
jgi:hypothetical protein